MRSEGRARIPSTFNIAEHFLERPAREHASRAAILGEPREVSYGELWRLMNRAGNALRRAGCEPGERVLLALPDSAEFIAAFFGAAKIGAIAVPVNPFVGAAEFAHFAGDSGARVGVVQASCAEEFARGTEGWPMERVMVVGEPGPGSPAWSRDPRWVAWEEALAGESEELAGHPTAASDPAFFLYTSGSGGRPKAAVHEHKDMLATSRGYAQGVLGLRADDRTFSVSKLFFAYGLGNGMYFPLSVGASTVLHPERPRAERVIEVIGRYRPTAFFAVPTLYAALLREADRGLRADFSSVRLAVSAGEVLPAELFERVQRTFGVEILDAIGSTEMLHMFIANRPGEARAGSCGKEVPGYDARIVDDGGEPVAPGAIGNLLVRGPSAMKGYWNNPELTARTKQGEWVATGDKFTRDAEGYYHYCGRADDMMKVAGMWVSPGEVENALLGHPEVAEAAVVGAGSADGLTRPVAFVVLRAGATGNAELAGAIREYVRARLEHYKCPQAVEFRAELPKTATGKIRRYLLREEGRG
jgi:benzoate-CoA ligase family protein